MSRLRSSLTIHHVLFVLVFAVDAIVFRDAAVNRAPDYDEGVYLAAIDAMRHGQEVGHEIFTAQPPGFYHLLELGSYVVGNTVNGVRGVVVACALLGSLGAYLVGRRIAGAPTGLLCAVLLAVAPSYATFSGRISADLPATALLLLGLAASYRASEERTLGRWVVAGLLCGAALTVKFSAVAIVPALLVLVLQARAPRRVAAFALTAGAALPWLVLLALHYGSVAPLWHGAVSYHTAARTISHDGLKANFEQIRRTYDVRDAFTWLVLAAVPCAVVTRNRLRPGALAPLLLWACASFVVLLWQRPLHDNHLVLLAAAIALPVGVILGSALNGLADRKLRVAVLAVLCVYLAGGLLQQHRQLVRNQVTLPGDAVWAIGQIRLHSRPADLIVADNQSIAYLAGRRVPGALVDTAVLRFETGYLTNAEVEDVVATRRIRLVVSDRAFNLRPKLLNWFATHFSHSAKHGQATVFWR